MWLMNSNAKIRLLVLLALIGIFFVGAFIVNRKVAVSEENPFLINSSENLPLTIQLASSMCLGLSCISNFDHGWRCCLF